MNYAKTYTVTTLDDSGPGSLRQAVLDANASVMTVDTINFAPSITGVLTLTSGQINITDRRLTISGPGRDVLAISGNNTSRVFYIEGTASGTTVQDLTLQNGNPPSKDPAYNEGAALVNTSIVTLNRLTFTGHSDCYSVLYNTGNLTANELTMTSNPCRGIYNSGGAVTANHLNLWQNKSSNGAGIYNKGNLTLMNSALVANAASEAGGGLYHESGTGVVRNTTFAGNSANSSGGGIYLYDGSLTLTNCSLIDNGAVDWGGGIENYRGDLVLANTIVSNNLATAGAELGEYDGYKGGGFENSFVSQGHNLIGVNGNAGITGLDDNIKLADTDFVLTGTAETAFSTFEDNGGMTFTYALVAGSPAIDAGDNSLIPAELTTDQRGDGFPRIAGAAVDIGAFESGSGGNAKSVLNVSVTGSGSVNSTPAGINCGSDCNESYDASKSIKLTAKPAAGYVFSKWTGCTGTNTTCTVTMDQARSVTATFIAAPQYNLSISVAGSGTVSSTPAGINCGNSCKAPFTSGTAVTLTAIPATGKTFTKWTGCTAMTTDPKKCTLTIKSNKTVLATFGGGTTNTPDLIVTGITLTPIMPKLNTSFTVKITVKNQGTSTATGGYLDVWANQSAVQTCGSFADRRIIIGSLAAGKTTALTATLTGTKVGTYKLRAFADGACTITESKETNNQLVKTYTVK